MKSWTDFRKHVVYLLEARRVPAAVGIEAAKELQAVCHSYLFQKRSSPRQALEQHLAWLTQIDSAADVLFSRISSTSSVSTFTGWTAADREALLTGLARLIAAARTSRRKHRAKRGPKGDRELRNLADGVAIALARHGIMPTTAKTGTFARVLEEVHAACGVPERDVHKSVRSACDRLSRSALIGSQRA